MSRDELKEVLEAILEELKIIRQNTAPSIEWPYQEQEDETKQEPWPSTSPTIVYGIGE